MQELGLVLASPASAERNSSAHSSGPVTGPALPGLLVGRSVPRTAAVPYWPDDRRLPPAGRWAGDETSQFRAQQRS